jgi:hypothetical protein
MPISQILLTSGSDTRPRNAYAVYLNSPTEGADTVVRIYAERWDGTTIYWSIVGKGVSPIDTNNDVSGSLSGAWNPGTGDSYNDVTTISFIADNTTEGTESWGVDLGTVPDASDIWSGDSWGVEDSSKTPPSNGTLATSLYFNGTSDRLGYAANDDWVMGTSDFTIEWFQWHTQRPGSNFPRAFSVHRWANSPLSLELGQLGGILWRNAQALNYTNPNGGADLKNQWVHYAIVRDTATSRLVLWVNGTQALSVADTTNYGGTGQVLTIGNEDVTQNGNFYGYITNFHWVKGTALYPTNNASILVPTTPITAVANTKLLLSVPNQADALSDYSGTSKEASVTTGVDWSPYGPF